MRLIIREAKKSIKKHEPNSLNSFMQFVEGFTKEHPDFNERDLNSRNSLVEFAQQNLAENEIVKNDLVNGTLIALLLSKARKTDNWMPHKIAGVLISLFNNWGKKKE